LEAEDDGELDIGVIRADVTVAGIKWTAAGSIFSGDSLVCDKEDRLLQRHSIAWHCAHLYHLLDLCREKCTVYGCMPRILVEE